ncbi:hypothetical protein A3759_11400 [Thalassolituus sp. HI0120]|nr:hypothetical protein A3759_11400 [Thalassolituus sp. HI0120]
MCSKLIQSVHDDISSFLTKFLMLGVLPIVFDSRADDETLCATVKIEISQELTLERQAFEATMRINNSLDSFELSDIGVDLVFREEDEKPVIVSSDASASTADFYVRLDDTTGIGG